MSSETGSREELAAARAAIRALYLADESASATALLQQARSDPAEARRIDALARELVQSVRAAADTSGLDAFMGEYDLSSTEGVVLMCLAEALLRIPDSETADRLIHDKLAHADWESHLGHASSLLVNAGTWGLMLTGRIVALDVGNDGGSIGSLLGRLAARSGEPVIRMALKEAMRILGHQFVMGRTIEEGIARSRQKSSRHYRHSFDMLGEAALSEEDAQRYFAAYRDAIHALALEVAAGQPLYEAPGISVKLSALHPRFEFAQAKRVRSELLPRVLELCHIAAASGLTLTLDAEESERLEPMLDVFTALCEEPLLKDWQGLGLAVQAYQKRAIAVIDYLTALARRSGRRIMVRLVKGAYWDSEIKHAQEQGLAEYPVFTRKETTDVSYLACARCLLAAGDALYPMFATHNARSVASIIEFAAADSDYEFQRLHGMGGALFDIVVTRLKRPCRIYAPVGSHEVLLAYLVRRLLENGANSSFVNRLHHAELPVAELIGDPCARLDSFTTLRHPAIPLPADLYRGRRNAQGMNLHDVTEIEAFAARMDTARQRNYHALPQLSAGTGARQRRCIVSPADSDDVIGEVCLADGAAVEAALQGALHAFERWSAMEAAQRAEIFERVAASLEQHRDELMGLIIREGGRTIADAAAEVREAVDFARYYALQLREQFGQTLEFDGPTGEYNALSLHGRGVFVAISPWNFPLAIFTGQVVAALVAGNCVIAKPAGQTPLTALCAVELMHAAGVPAEVLHCLPGSGAVLGEQLLGDPRVAGVVFTGSTDTARHIQRRLAARDGAIIPLIAETGGQNAMIVDSSALPEQFVPDVIRSAFNSAGQRCSALRVLFLQNEIAARGLELIRGAMQQLRIGNPLAIDTDIGPVIDSEAQSGLRRYCEMLRGRAQDGFEMALPVGLERGSFVAPACFEIEDMSLLEREIFGPVLHVIRYDAAHLDAVIRQINDSGYGLTLGIHTRINERAEYIRRRVRVGNVYINRNMVGAVVGVQPFGGEGLSGTGPKAGGPYYLQRFATERSVSINTAAVGGNTRLLGLDAF